MAAPKQLQASDYQLIAQRIRQMVEFGKGMSDCGLTRRAIVALLQESTKLPKRDIELVLDGIDGLKNWVLVNS